MISAWNHQVKRLRRIGEFAGACIAMRMCEFACQDILRAPNSPMYTSASVRSNQVGKEEETGSRVTLHVVSSLDGFIARTDNTVSWLDVDGSVYEAGGSISADEAASFVKTIDCYVLGSRTYQHALELGWPYGDTPTVVVSSRQWPPSRQSVEFYSGDLKTLIDQLAPRFRNIWLVGGAMLCQRFLSLGLVDEIRLTIAPVLLGNGLRLFGDLLAEQRWDLKNVVAYRNGFVELSYAAATL